MNILEEKVNVDFTSVDPSGKITLFSVFDLFQKLAIKHAERLGVGRTVMLSSGRVWLISRVSVLIERRPILDEDIVIRTWPHGSERLFFMRDYDISTTEGVRIARGRAGWIVVDIKSRRPLRPSEAGLTLPQNGETETMIEMPAGLSSRDDLVKTSERKVLYSDIDLNVHVNNARYVQWVQDIIDPKTLENASKMRFDINYVSEVKCGDTIEFWTMRNSGATFIEGRKVSDGTAGFRAQLSLDE
ncbi:MAG: acyl-ACP thioesterase [Spirochaetaceae bacterium]|jgi:acyl-ACP thioesterase|nr:acyl-ACP thioesterase [Spirochaetaceae bacterium]